MFFSQALLWRNGPVANIWTAAYCFKKLKREQIAEIDIVSSVDQIIGDIEISYRIVAHLLVGIVKIFSKKVEFLEEDCNKTLKTLTESFRAIYWTNPQKTKHVRKQTAHVPDNSSVGVHTGMKLLEALQAHSDQVVISVPARFELDLFDLEIADDCEAPDRHQLLAPCANSPLDESESDFFQHKTYRKGSGCRIFSSTCFGPIEDVIPVEIMIDLDLHIEDLYGSVSSKREETALNPDENVLGEHQESIHNLHAEDPNGVAESVEPSAGFHESPLKDVNADACASAEQHRESIQNLHEQDPNGKAEAAEPSAISHGSPLKDINLPSKEKHVPILKTMRIDELLKLADLPTTDPGLFSPKPMVRTPAKRDISTNLRKRKISWCCDQEIILSNGVMRNAIHDPSDLVRGRKNKVPRNCLEAWRVERYSSVDQLFTEPLIPCTFSKVQAGASEYTPHKPDNHSSKLENPINAPCENFTDVNNVVASEFEDSRTHCIESEVQENETIEKSVNASDMRISRSEKIRRRLFDPKTPEQEPQEISTDLSDWVHENCEVPSGFGSLPDGPTPRISTRTSSDTTVSSLDGELGSHDDGDGDADQTKEGSIWSARTRYVAHHLHQQTSNLKRKNQEICLSLEQILQGKKRKTCARFFYETLMLKGRGMIDVKQESPYGDIQISLTRRLDEEFGDI